ncbi:GNAT family N-acetyltransferase [Umezawaea endophytica]|uniref:GNAT family N-acetyltransferase n=1 Tax=Umezawaea endophytica TaxID=1654476 RepID=A0A9X2VGH8_9PSEU|nr:GNAT family N-acetyltransferase [Umezawaea endophytica]MCS7476208.1 GNAT family N-acetyltransferase [Umezawaea endophytica]
MGLTIRTLREADYQAFGDMIAAAFLADPSPSDAALERPLYDLDRVHGVFEGAELIGSAGAFVRTMAVPGAAPQPTAAVTSVGVKPGHRRRGVLTSLMRAQLHGLHDDGLEAVAALWASEGAIYGRYGYGLGAQFTDLRLPRGAAFHPGVDVGADRVREAPREEALPLARALYDRVAANRPGYLNRGAAEWEYHLADDESHRDGLSAYRFVLHPRGYAVYRVKNEWDDRGPRHELNVRELTAEDDQAYAALYRYLLDVDLTAELRYFTGSDDPVFHLLRNPRLARRSNRDSPWVRLVDLDRALTGRGYLSDVDVVLDVTDDFCPWNADRWRLTVKEGEAAVRRVTDEPDVTLDISALGAAFLGGTRLTTLARAQFVRERRPGAVRALSHAFLGETAPHCPEVF